MTTVWPTALINCSYGVKPQSFLSGIWVKKCQKSVLIKDLISDKNLFTKTLLLHLWVVGLTPAALLCGATESWRV